MVETGLLGSVFRGVYAVGPMPLADHGRFMAGTIAAAPSLLADRSALVLQSLLDPSSGPVHVITEGSARRRQAGLVALRTCRLPKNRRDEIEGIPVVVPMLALVQATPRLYPSEIREVLLRAERQGALDPILVDAILVERPNLRHRRRLLEALAPHRQMNPSTRSPLESRFILECRRRAVNPMPATNVPLDRFEVDFLWRHSGLVVEVDGFEGHGSREAFDRDRARWARITALGHPLIIVTDRRLRDDGDALFAEIAAVNSR